MLYSSDTSRGGLTGGVVGGFTGGVVGYTLGLQHRILGSKPPVVAKLVFVLSFFTTVCDVNTI